MPAYNAKYSTQVSEFWLKAPMNILPYLTVSSTSLKRQMLWRGFRLKKLIVTYLVKEIPTDRRTQRLLANRGGCTVYGVGLKRLDWWDCGFEPSWGYEYSSLVFVVCCVGSGFCDELITRSEETYRVSVWSRKLKTEVAQHLVGLLGYRKWRWSLRSRKPSSSAIPLFILDQF